MALTGRELRAHCLDMPAAVEEFPFGPETSVFKVMGKIFALSALSATPLQVSMKCDPEIAVGLRAGHPAITAGYHLNKRHWNTVTVDGSLPDTMVCDLIQDSFDLVVDSLPRYQRIRLR
jgi:predicted DNA-binding protein (MmcQ/YjbR family)